MPERGGKGLTNSGVGFNPVVSQLPVLGAGPRPHVWRGHFRAAAIYLPSCTSAQHNACSFFFPLGRYYFYSQEALDPLQEGRDLWVSCPKATVTQDINQTRIPSLRGRHFPNSFLRKDFSFSRERPSTRH